jgi:hypothetical protein
MILMILRMKRSNHNFIRAAQLLILATIANTDCKLRFSCKITSHILTIDMA